MRIELSPTWQGKAIVKRMIKTEHIPGAKAVSQHVLLGDIGALSVYNVRRGKKPIAVGLPEVRKFGTLYDFQNYGVSWILDKWRRVGGALLADDMGLGKTAQTITAACERMSQRDSDDRAPVLIVCPASVRLTWETEIGKWAGDFAHHVAVITGAGDLKKLEAKVPPLWVICSYETLRILPDLIPYILIIDEAHNFSGRNAKRTKRLEHFASLATYKLALTGTPIWSRPRDYWQLLQVLFDGAFGRAWDFDHAYCGAYLNEHGGLENRGSTRANELKLRMSYYQLRRLRSEVKKEIPSLKRQVIHVPATARATHEFRHSMVHRSKGSTYKALSASLEGKMETAMELARTAKRFFLVTWQKKHAEFMYRKLNADGTPCYLITGDISHKKRQALVTLAAKEGAGIVATIDSTGTGVDGLQHVASIGVMHSTDFVSLKLRQCEARLDRIGQTEPVLWYYLVMKESMDEWVQTTVIEKLDQWKQLMGVDESEDLSAALDGRESGETLEQLEKKALHAMWKEIKRAA